MGLPSTKDIVTLRKRFSMNVDKRRREVDLNGWDMTLYARSCVLEK